MALVASTMTTNIITALNATPANFQISQVNTPETYAMINEACKTFTPIYATFGLDMQPGLGPPPSGSYPHFHTMLGTTVAAKIIQYTNTFNNAMNAVFPVPGHQVSFAQCWSNSLLTALDSAQMVSSVAQGEVTHVHNWSLAPVPSTVAASAASCMVSSWTYMGQTFNPAEPLSQFNNFVTEFAKEFIRAVRIDTTWAPATGAGHIHALS
jgi:hypothetical protein